MTEGMAMRPTPLFKEMAVRPPLTYSDGVVAWPTPFVERGGRTALTGSKRWPPQT